jgi:hypothetical protein
MARRSRKSSCHLQPRLELVPHPLFPCTTLPAVFYELQFYDWWDSVEHVRVETHAMLKLSDLKL